MARSTSAPATRARSFAWRAPAKARSITIPASRTSPAWPWIPQGRLLAGTEPNGILYRITAKDKAFALYDSSLPEIRAIVPMPDGTVYAAALGGSVAKRAQAAQQAAQGMSGAPPSPPPPSRWKRRRAAKSSRPKPSRSRKRAAPHFR
jgi:hypothetical protein